MGISHFYLFTYFLYFTVLPRLETPGLSDPPTSASEVVRTAGVQPGITTLFFCVAWGQSQV